MLGKRGDVASERSPSLRQGHWRGRAAAGQMRAPGLGCTWAAPLRMAPPLRGDTPAARLEREAEGRTGDRALLAFQFRLSAVVPAGHSVSLDLGLRI
jgi:hypothetical protein